ncbi:hypothetical protein BJN34_21640 [Cupriavidus necator]|uniref:Uncharacterized protein n=1 Tax=Cupriavidus necator TaxID=106590 RepID=A0A1U9UUV8_CUPNE|nr:hypothetical protein [Cupriavidus necator]AQV96474.1 hypothetical protein BJN34_21640 [Cupriavidus necator]
MKIASIELTRVCTIGGEWNGRGHEGANTFWEEPSASESLESFDAFRAAVAACISACPYVHYDDEAEQIVQINDDWELFAYDEDGNWTARTGLEVLKLKVPDDKFLLDWYEDLKAWRDA